MRLASIFLLALAGCTAATPPKNVVVILVDDLGWIDTGAYGSTFYETPAIDQLASDGMRFTQFYAASGVCSPTRASLMTGKHPARLQITNWIGGEQAGPLLQAEYRRALPLEEVTLGEAFRDAGYTTGYIGKWHLGQEGFMPKDQGFAFTRAVNHAGQPGSFFAPYENPNFAISNVPDLDGDPEGTYLTDRLTDFAVEFMENAQDDPFFLYLSLYNVHTPLQAKPEHVEYFQDRIPEADSLPAFQAEGTLGTTRQRQDHAVYAGMIRSVDESVQRIRFALDSLGVADNTVIVFTSDNGGLSTLQGDRRWAPTSNLPLRAGKGFLYEGGTRIPFIVYDPSGEASALIDLPGTTEDLLPTLHGLAGLPVPPGLDGIDLSPVTRGMDLSDRALYWHFPHYHGSGNRPSGAIRYGDYKLIEWLEDGATELYNLRDDVAESSNLASDQPGKAAELLALLHAWRDTVGAQMPTPNPDYQAP